MTAYFSAETLQFLSDLENNNSRDWFKANKMRYDTAIKAPAADFGTAMAKELAKQTGHTHTPKLFRIHRDLRFSKDKTPYNTHVHMSFAPQTAQPAPPMWMFGLDRGKLSLGAGLFAFDRSGLSRFRDEVTGAKGGRIARMLDNLVTDGYRLGAPELKRVPPGYDKDHPRADLLRHKGLSAWCDLPPDFATRTDLVQRCMDRFAPLLPLFNFLHEAA